EVPVPSTGERIQTYRFAYGNNYFSLKYVDLRLPSTAAKVAAVARLEEYTREYIKTIIDAGGQVLTRTTLADSGTEFISKYPVGESRGMAYEQSRVYF